MHRRELGASLLRALALLAAGAGAGLGANALRPDGVAIRDFSPPVACTGPGEHEAAPALVSVTEAASLCGRRGVLFADARTPARYAEGHIAEAIHLPCESGAQVASEALGRLGAASTVVVYGQATGEAADVAATLRRRLPGVDVRVLEGGFEDWQTRGNACASGPCDDCMASRPGVSP
jgi:rhodanese-related sulfurtransferase